MMTRLRKKRSIKLANVKFPSGNDCTMRLQEWNNGKFTVSIRWEFFPPCADDIAQASELARIACAELGLNATESRIVVSDRVSEAEALERSMRAENSERN